MTPKWIFAPFLLTCVGISMLAGLQWLDRTYPLDLSKLAKSSFVVEDRNGALLRGFATKDGRWRLPVKVGKVDPRFIKMLLAYEDKRFYRHGGVDVVALLRSGGQMLMNGRIVSGGSTLTMQLARLLEGPSKRSISVKLRQIGRALQIEQRLSKQEILSAYLQLAPYGGNLEGVRAASLAYFGKEPKVLDAGQAALLVALPQSPETRRPDRFKAGAIAARNRVLARMVGKGLMSKAEGERASSLRLSGRRQALPALAAHLSDQVRRKYEKYGAWRTTIDRSMQARLESLVKDEISNMAAKVSVAVLVADHASGDIVAQIASPDFFNSKRAGEVDMINALRSPGSTLKPFIYGLAFEEGVVHPASLIEDSPVDFSGYRPRNFDLGYQGTVKVERALQLSLNIPAIKLLNSVGPDKLLARFRRAGVEVKLPRYEPVGLAVGLGGLGISLRDLVQLYTALPNGGRSVRLVDGLVGRSVPDLPATPDFYPRSLGKVAAWYVQEALAGVAAPQGASNSEQIAYKTGTSYGYRDAWSVGFDGRYVIGIWVGRPDGASVPGITGRRVAAPILFAAFGRLSGGLKKLQQAPQGVLALRNGQLPESLKRFTPRGKLVQHYSRVGTAPGIVYPRPGVRVDLGLTSSADNSPLYVKIQGGKAPFRWLANGKPILEKQLRRQIQWQPDSAGFSTLTVLDAIGRVASVRVFVE